MSSTTAVVQVTEFVRALALSWKNLAAYPPGHPVLVKSLDEVNRRLAELRGPAGEVLLGISNDGLLYGDAKIESLSAQKFAQALYSRGVALLRMSSETNAHDIDAFLRLLAAGAPKDQPRAIWEDLTAAGVVNINLQPVSYTAMQLTDNLDEKKEYEASLWDAILRALMEGRQFSEEGHVLPAHVDSAEELTRMINEYLAAELKQSVAFDPDATFGIRMPVHSGATELASMLSETVGQYIANAWGLKKQNSIQQALQLLQSLPDPLREAILRSVVRALAFDDSAGGLLREFATELPSDDVLEALRYLSSVDKLSSHAISLLESLTAIQARARVPSPSQSVIADLVRTFADDDADRFNPDDHRELLKSAAIRVPRVPPDLLVSMEQLGRSSETVAHQAVMRQFAAMTLELLEDPESATVPAVLLKRLESIFRSEVKSGDFAEALNVLEQLRHVGDRSTNSTFRKAVADSLARLADPEVVADLVSYLGAAKPEAIPPIQRLIDALGPSVRRNLLVALAEEDNRSRRRRLFDFVASLGPAMVPDIVAFLSDSRWYVVRNMIIILRAMQDRSSLPELRKLAHHSDLRVKLEALKSLLALEPDAAAPLLEELFKDPDPKIVDTAVSLVGSYGIKEGIDPLLKIVEGNDIMGTHRSLRIKAIRALGDLGDERALEHLGRFFKQSILPWPAKEERYAAWQTLEKYPAEARQPLVDQGLRSRDPQVRAICEGVTGS